MNKTKIEWADYTWNPIRGLCSVGCWYCYARKMYRRFKWEEGLRITPSYPAKTMDTKKPKKIFVCSTMELFHPDIPKHWRDMIFGVIERHPQHTFQILTKMPENIDRPMPDNAWLGVSITDDGKLCGRYQDLLDAEARIKFISFEPLFNLSYLPLRINWVIIGRLTGYGRRYDPSLAVLKSMVDTYRAEKISIFLKDSLKEIWGEKLIQEFPE